MTSENDSNSLTTEDVVEELSLLQQPESLRSHSENDSVLIRSPTNEVSNTNPNVKQFDLEKEELANKIHQLEALVKEATICSPHQSNYGSINSPLEMELRSSLGLLANSESIHLLREAVKSEPGSTVNRNQTDIPAAGETNFEVYSETLESDDMNEAFASSSETLVGEGPEDQALLEDGTGELTPTYVSIPIRGAGSNSQRYGEPSSFGGKDSDLQLSQQDYNQMTAGDNLVRNFDDFVEMRLTDIPRKENEYLVPMGHPRDLPIHTKPTSSSASGKTSSREKSKLKSNYLEGPSCRPKERRKQLKKSWSNQEVLEPPASPDDRRASFNDLFSFNANNFYVSRQGGSPMSNFEVPNKIYTDEYPDSSLMYEEPKSEVSHPNLDMNGRNIAEQISITLKSKYNYDSEFKIPVDIKAAPAPPFGLPPDPNHGKNLHKKYGSDMRKAPARVRRISKPLSIAETNKIYSSIKQSSKKMQRQTAVSDEGESLGSSITTESPLHEQMTPSFDSFSYDGKCKEEIELELERRTKLFFENMNTTDKETHRQEGKNNYRGRHSFPKDAADILRPGELQPSNIYYTSSKSHDELDPDYSEKFYDRVPISGTPVEEHYSGGYETSLDIREQLRVQDPEHARIPSLSSFPGDSRPPPPTTLKFLDTLPPSPHFPPLGPLDKARSGPSTPIRPEKAASKAWMRSSESSIHDSYDLAIQPESCPPSVYRSQPWLLENLPTEEIRRSNSFAMTTTDPLGGTVFPGNTPLQQLYPPQRGQKMDSVRSRSPRNSRETVQYGRLSPSNPLETFEASHSHSSQRSSSFGNGFPVASSISDPPSPVSQGLLKPPEGAPVRRGSIVSCDTLQVSLDPQPDPVKIVVLGDDGVGKTALIVRLVTGRFIGDYDPSLEAVYSYRIPLAGYSDQLQLMDTAGQGAWRGEETQLQWSDAVLVVFSVTSARSLKVACDILQNLKKIQQSKLTEGSIQDCEETNGGNTGVDEEKCSEISQDCRKNVGEIVVNDEKQKINQDDCVEDGDLNKKDEKDGEGYGKESTKSFSKEGDQENGNQNRGGMNELQADSNKGSNLNISIREEVVTEEANKPHEGQSSVASLRKLATRTLTGFQKSYSSNVCDLARSNKQEWEAEEQGEDDPLPKQTILSTESCKSIENLNSCSISETVDSPRSMVDISVERIDETQSNLSKNALTVSESTTTKSEEQKIDSEVSNLLDYVSDENETAVQYVANSSKEMKLRDNAETEQENKLEAVQVDQNAPGVGLHDKIVNKADSSGMDENIITSNVMPPFTLNNSSISEKDIYSESDSLQSEKSITMSSQVSDSNDDNSVPSTGATEVCSDLQISTQIKESSSSSSTNIEKKEPADDASSFLWKETVLLGNKSDLEHRREVSTAEGVAVAEQYHCHYSEIAASAPWELVSEPFLDLYRQVQEGRERKRKQTEREKENYGTEKK